MPITTTPSGGPQGEFSTNTPIYSTTLSATTTSVVFSNIPTTFTDLVLVVNGSFSGTDYLNLQFNGDTSTSYSDLPFRGNGSSASAGAASSRAFIHTSTDAGANARFMCRSNIQNYANPNINKSVLSRGDSTTSYVAINVGTWRKTEPITSIRVYALSGNNFNIGTTFTIYGIKAAAPAPKATGGDVITTDGTYWYHAFRSSSVFNLNQAVTADILVVAGGGGGGYGSQVVGSPGGAGGLQYLASQSLTASPYSVTVGAGASGRIIEGGINFDGSNSQFGSLTASVGGGGGGYDPFAFANGRTGGSGGGGAPGYPDPARSPGTGGSASPSGQGNAGGNGATSGSASFGAGGGGGAGGVGGNATSSSSGNGGVGLTNSNINAFAAATGTGQLVSGSYYYAGGGGGGGTVNSAGGTGGHGGGGSGAYNSNASPSGTINTGGGGGGGANATGGTNRPGGSGGSGIVIVRYPV
jgi:hypothetical protein